MNQINRNHYTIVESNGKKFLKFPVLEQLNINHFFTTSDIMFHKYDDLTQTADSFNQIFSDFKMDKNIHFFTSQVHSDNIELANLTNTNYRPHEIGFGYYFEDCDGLISNEKNTTLITKFADCTPIVLYDTKTHCIANLHSGWRGTSKQIFIKALSKMVTEFNSKLENIIVIIGPCIGALDFEVQNDVIDIFKNSFKNINIENFYTKKDSIHYMLDMQSIIERALLDYGILAQNIYTADISTYSSNFMHSFRRDGEKAGRMILGVSL